MELRIKKQIIIGGVFILILGVSGFFIYLTVKIASPPEVLPIVFQNLEIEWAKIFKLSNNLYDLGARVKNVNLEHGTSSLEYAFRIFDKDNNLC